MNDEELTVLATKAFSNVSDTLSPLTDDADALRLAVKLCLVVDIDEEARVVWVTKPWCAACPVSEPFDDDPFSATRRAITRAAAAIQLSKESK